MVSLVLFPYGFTGVHIKKFKIRIKGKENEKEDSIASIG